MKPLDEGQQRELDHLRSQRGWVTMTRARRVLTAAVVALVPGGVVAAVSALAGGPWLGLGVGTTVVVLLALAAHVLAPERALVWSVRSTLPTAEAMKRGENVKNWPG